MDFVHQIWFMNPGMMISAILGALTLLPLVLYIHIRASRKFAAQQKTAEVVLAGHRLKNEGWQIMEKLIVRQQEESHLAMLDLHDSLGSTLTALRLTFENVELRLSGQIAGTSLFEKTSDILDEAYTRVKQLGSGSPTGFYPQSGLPDAFADLAQCTAASGMGKVDIVCFGFDARLDNVVEIATFLTVQDLAALLISNARSSGGMICLTQHGNNIDILADGISLRHCNGQFNVLQQRVAQLGGTLQTRTKDDKDTTIKINIPV